MKTKQCQQVATVEPRREFLKTLALGAGGLALTPSLLAATQSSAAPPDYKGPNVIVVRFGGGVRRRESIFPATTYSPFVCHELTKRGVLFKNMEIDSFHDYDTSHGQGTLYIVSGKYEKYKDIGSKFLGQRFESKVPTIFEYFRKNFNVPEHQALIINGEDRTDEEFYNFSNHHLFGATFRSQTLSLFRYKTHLFRRQIAAGKLSDKDLKEKKELLAKMESLDYRTNGENGQPAEIEGFWERWREFYGESGYVNPRGDRLLTELALRALKELQPRLLMINYNDPDYVHWGNLAFYTRGVSIIDEGVRQLFTTVEADPFYRDNTIFVIVPDCGRDSNPFAEVPCQHHFNSRSAHEIFALMVGPGMQKGAVVDHRVDQISVAATVCHAMGMKAEFAEGPVLQEAFA